MSKPRYRLHFFWFDGKTPLWWVTRLYRGGGLGTIRSTGGYSSSVEAIRAAARL